jgi:peptide/nickel transport system substrate-binding protein
VKKSKLFLMFSAFMVLSMLLVACQPAATPTAAPEATQAPAATATTAPEPTAAPEATATTAAPEATATTAAPAFTPLKQEADCAYGGELKSIEAPDAKTVKFVLCNPDAAFLAKVAFTSNEILPKALLDATGGDSAKISEKPVGTGPYVLKEWVRGDHITLEANPNYWGGAPTLKTITIKWAKEPAQKLLELQSGNTDAIDAVGPDDIATVKADANLGYYPAPATNTLYFAMNNTVKPFDNEKVRQAFAQAIDKQRIVDNFFPTGSSVAEEFVYPELKPGFTDGMTWYKFDKDAAKKALTDAGFDFNQTILFSYRTAVRGYNPQPDKIAQDVQAQLAEIGVKIKLDVQESGTLLANAAAGKLGFFLLGWGEDYPDATDWYDYHFGPNLKSFGTPYADLVAAIQAGAQSADPKVRQQHYDDVNKLIMEHVPMIPIAHGAVGQAYKASVKNVIVGPYNLNFPQMTTDTGTLVYTQSAEPIQIWCGDETDGETHRACQQLYEPLMAYKYGGTETIPALATSFTANADLTEFTFTLRDGVKWSDGSDFSAADVFATYTAMWDFKNPNHKGNTGTFEYWKGLFGAVLNEPAAK